MKAAGWLAVVLAAGFWLVIGVVFQPIVTTYWRLKQSSAVAEGVVTDWNPKDHSRATYEYEVGGQRYTADELGSPHRTGDRVRVYYVPADPSICSTSEPGRAFRDAIMGGAMLLVASAVAAVWMANRNIDALTRVTGADSRRTSPHR